MPYCPKCGVEVSETDTFCRRCGFNLTQLETLPSTPEAAVKAVVTQRIDGIRRKSPETILSIADKERYTKFDDWPPFERQGPEALNREDEAFEVLKEYDYETSGWRIDVFENASVASFIINYRGTIRDRSFNIKSRVTAFLIKRDGEWKLVHEHWSRFPEEKGQRETRRRWFPHM